MEYTSLGDIDGLGLNSNVQEFVRMVMHLGLGNISNFEQERVNHRQPKRLR